MDQIQHLNDLLVKAGFSKLDPDNGMSLSFTNTVTKLCEEIGQLYQTEENVNQIKNLSDFSHWMVELSSFLKEIKCPYQKFYEGHLNSRLSKMEERCLLIDYLLGEVLTARIWTPLPGSSVPENLNCITKTLNLGVPPPSATIIQFFKQIISAIQKVPDEMRKNLIGQPLLKVSRLSPQQWKTLTKISELLEVDYSLRRSILVQRFYATIQSFLWSSKLDNGKKSEIESYLETFQLWYSKVKVRITVADVLTARNSLLIVAKISKSSKSPNALKRVKVGTVPDRGGRANECAPPPPEVPSWQQRKGSAHNPQQYQRANQSSNDRQNQGYQQNLEGFQSQDSNQQRSYNGGQKYGAKGHNRNRGIQGGGWKKDRQF